MKNNTKVLKDDWKRVLSKRLYDELESRKDKDYKYSQAMFSKALNISPSMLTQLLNKERNITIDNAYVISKELNCSIDYLLRDDVPKSNVPNSKEIDIQKISNYLGLSENSIFELKRLNDDGYSKYINELLFNYYEFEEIMYLIMIYFEYEKELDSNPNEEIHLNGINIDKNELYLLKLRDRLMNIKNSTSIAESKYIKIINDTKNEIEKTKKHSDKSKLSKYALFELNSKLNKYTQLLNGCKYVKDRFDDLKFCYSNLTEKKGKEGK